jgi:tripartite-type tricarboxylate transporter receptor subunit TctC
VVGKVRIKFKISVLENACLVARSRRLMTDGNFVEGYTLIKDVQESEFLTALRMLAEHEVMVKKLSDFRERYKMTESESIAHAPYRGDGPAMADLIAGQVQVGFATMTASIGYIRADRLRPLAVCTIKRSQPLPNIPTVAEFVPGFEASSWFGVAAPKGTPAGVIEGLNREINAGLADPTIKERLVDIGGMPLPGLPADFGKLISDETEKWSKVIQEAGIKAE